MGDPSAEFGERRDGERADREAGDGGGRFVASEPVEDGRENGEGHVYRAARASTMHTGERRHRSWYNRQP